MSLLPSCALVATLAFFSLSAQNQPQPRPGVGIPDVTVGALVRLEGGGSQSVGKVHAIEGRWVKLLEQDATVWVNADEVFRVLVVPEDALDGVLDPAVFDGK